MTNVMPAWLDWWSDLLRRQEQERVHKRDRFNPRFPCIFPIIANNVSGL